jgi:glycosyltransferase involved in cell wall biosynthesis
MDLILPNLSVIICAYTEDRWQDLVEAVDSIKGQLLPPGEIIVVIDHNPVLLERAARALAGVVVIENRQPRGLSGARNCGIAAAQGELVAFMDEDAIAAPDCLALLCRNFNDPRVLGVGGASLPLWSKNKPGWLPEEFYWVVGCTYRGLPQSTTPVRNLIGCNMVFRRKVFDEVGGFRIGIGRIGTNPVGCEETELCIRAGQYWHESYFLFEPAAAVYHHVSKSRADFWYFVKRCYSEGVSKALVARFVGSGKGLASERSYTLHTLPQGILRGIGETISRRNFSGVARSAAILAGLAITTAGYLCGRFISWGRSFETPPDFAPQPLRSQAK